MEEIELRRIMKNRNLAVIGVDVSTEDKIASMIKALYIVIPPKSVSDRTTIRNIVKHYSKVAESRGEPPDSIFKMLIDFALEASGPFSRVPAAVFMTILKKEMGYQPETTAVRCP